MLNFRDVLLEDRSQVCTGLSCSRYLGCDLSFLNLFAWQPVYKTQVCFDQKMMFIRYMQNEHPLYAFPAGCGSQKEALARLIELEGKQLRLYMGQEDLELMQHLYPEQFEVSEYRDAEDYVYLRSDLADLKGKKYNGKRNHINKFRSLYPDYQVQKVDSSCISDCLRVFEQWSAARDGEDDRVAVLRACEHFEFLQCEGILIYVDDNPVAFTIGTRRSPDMFITHFEKCIPGFETCYSVINNEFAKRLDGQYINREDDVGLEGLRKAKLSYHPAFLLKKYMARYIGE